MTAVEPHQVSDSGPTERYLEDGYLFPVEVFTRDEAAGYRRQLEALEERIAGS